jgi:hypothetical protein
MNAMKFTNTLHKTPDAVLGFTISLQLRFPALKTASKKGKMQ